MATTLSYVLRFLDAIFGIGASLAVIDLFKLATSAEPVFSFINGIDLVVRVAFGFIGAVYLGFRVHHFYYDSKLNRQIKREDLKTKIKNNA